MCGGRGTLPMYFQSWAGSAGARAAMSPSPARLSADGIRGRSAGRAPRAWSGSGRVGTPPAIACRGAALVDWPDARLASFGRRIRELRATAKLSQEQLAERAGLHWTYVSDVERGRRGPSLDVIGRLALGLGVSPSEVFAALRDRYRPRRRKQRQGTATASGLSSSKVRSIAKVRTKLAQTTNRRPKKTQKTPVGQRLKLFV